MNNSSFGRELNNTAKMSNMTTNSALRTAVERLFNSWTALQLAVEQGMGGSNAKNMAMQMIDYVTEYCCINEQIDVCDLKNVLDDIMDEEFETICEDNSTQEIAQLLARYRQLCSSNMQDQMLLEVSRLPPCQLWLCKQQIQHSLPIQAGETIHDDDDNDIDEDNSTTQSETMDNDADSGWTVVRTRKKH